jgi:hypothetical protein
VYCRSLTVLMLAVRTQAMVVAPTVLASVALPIDRRPVLIHQPSAFVAKLHIQFLAVKRPTAIYAT